MRRGNMFLFLLFASGCIPVRPTTTIVLLGSPSYSSQLLVGNISVSCSFSHMGGESCSCWLLTVCVSINHLSIGPLPLLILSTNSSFVKVSSLSVWGKTDGGFCYFKFERVILFFLFLCFERVILNVGCCKLLQVPLMLYRVMFS